MDGVEIDKLIQQKKQNEQALAAAKRRLSNAPPGNIILRNIRGKTRVYKRVALPQTSTSAQHENQDADKMPGKTHAEKYVSAIEHPSEIRTLADKRYCEILCSILTNEIAVLDTFIKNYAPQRKYEIFDEFPESIRADMSPFFISAEECCKRWQAAPFESNDYPYNSDQEIRTARGEQVRSRAECIIADMLNRHGLAYHYEQRLPLKSGDLYPDFTVMHPKSCEPYYIEFFGMMSNPEYVRRAMEKIRKYQNANLGPYLISIFDSPEVPFRTGTVEIILKNYF